MQLAPVVIRFSAVPRGLQKEAHDGCVAHLAESPVGAVDPAAEDAEPSGIDLPRQLIILGIERLLVESADFVKSGFVDQHEHPGRKRPMEAREPLCQVIADIQKVVSPTAIPAQNIRRHAVQGFAFHQIDRASQKSAIREFDICVDEENVAAVRAAGAVITADRWQSTDYDRHWQISSEALGNLNRAVRRICVSQEYSRIRDQRIILIQQRLQQARQQGLLVLRRYDNRQLVRCTLRYIH